MNGDDQPFQVKTATGAILTPSMIAQKTSGDPVARQSVPGSTKGIKKAKSMAFNSLSNRLDRDSQARQFLNQAIKTS